MYILKGPHFRGFFILYPEEGWNRGVPKYTKVVYSFGIEGFYCNLRCPHFKISFIISDQRFQSWANSRSVCGGLH